MQSNQVIINGTDIELSDATRIGVTFQANNIGDLQSRQGTFTNQFKIPLTLKNKQTLEHVDLTVSASVIPYRRNSATYIENGIEIVSDGEAILKKTDSDYAYIDIIGGNMDLVRAIGDVRVGDLYIPDGSFVWNNTNMIASNDKSKYYIFPLIDWRIDLNNFFSSTTISPQQMLPCCYIPQMITRLEEYTGFKFKGTHIDSDNHLNMVLTPDELTLDPQSVVDTTTYARVLNHDGDPYSDPIIPASSNYPFVINEGSGYVQQNYPINWAINYKVVNNIQVDMPGFFQGVYYPPVNNTGRLKFVGTLGAKEEYINGGLGFLEFPKTVEYWFVAQIKYWDGVSGGVLAEYTSDHVGGTITGGDVADWVEQVIDISTDEMIFEVGTQYYCEVTFHAQRHDNADAQILFYIEDNGNGNFQHVPTNTIVYGNDIRFQDIFRMKVSDVLKDILNKYGIIIQTNSYTKEIYLNYFSDLIANKSRALDWSDKIDIRENELSYKFGKYGQRNNMLFKTNTSVPDGLGDYFFNVDDETLDDEVDVIKFNHPATVETNRYLGYNIPTIEAIDSLNKWQKPDYRILQLKCQNTSFTVNYNDGVSNPTTQTSVPFANFKGMDELAPIYYEPLIDILQKTKVQVLNTKLLSSDISSLDFTIPIFLDVPEKSINGYFYINKISNYKSGTLTQVEYVRL